MIILLRRAGQGASTAILAGKASPGGPSAAASVRSAARGLTSRPSTPGTYPEPPVRPRKATFTGISRLPPALQRLKPRGLTSFAETTLKILVFFEQLAEEVSARLKAKALSGATITLKLKTADFRIRTRARSLGSPTQLARKIFAAARGLLERETDGTKYR